MYHFILSILSLQTFHMLLDIGIRMVTHDTICFVQRYFLGRAQTSYASRGTTVPASLQWLFRPKGHRFFVSSRWTCQGGDSMWASISDKSECNFLKKRTFPLLLFAAWNRAGEAQGVSINSAAVSK